ncbi:MAG TPA: hypothetical protein VN926_06960 [Bradyrhizobium sp.]|jgi:hypothetical protein|nr:hypothetical protein [Bradyrhizobium sp.]
MNNTLPTATFGMSERRNLLRKPATCRPDRRGVLRSGKPGVCALSPRSTDGWQPSKILGQPVAADGLEDLIGQAASLGLATTVMIQRVGLLDFTSMTERTNPVTSDPFTVTFVFWPRCWS